MTIDFKKLEVQLDENHNHLVAFLQTIQETVDHIVEENKQQGEDITRNTKAIKLMEIELEDMRKKLEGQDKKVEQAAQTGAENAVKDNLPKAVDKGIKNFIEPVKKRYNLKGSRLKFWKRG